MKVGVLLVVVLLISACASVRILPQADGNYFMVATSSSETAAYDAALEDGTEHCEKLNGRFAIVNKTTEYQGMDKDLKGVIGAVGILTSSRRNNNHMMGAYTNRHDDYKVEITFKCL